MMPDAISFFPFCNISFMPTDYHKVRVSSLNQLLNNLRQFKVLVSQSARIPRGQGDFYLIVPYSYVWIMVFVGSILPNFLDEIHCLLKILELKLLVNGRIIRHPPAWSFLQPVAY